MDSVVLIEKLSKFGKVGNKDILKNIPEDYRRYKCHKCFFIVDSDPCPNCGETLLEVACPLDHCDCHDEIISGIKYCPVCGDAI